MRVFLAVDVHASSVCFRKFLNALRLYKADVGIILGDLTGKMLIPLVERPGGIREGTLAGQPVRAETKEELDKIKGLIELAGYYWVEATEEEFRELSADKPRQDALFKRLVLERLKSWMDLADERLAGAGVQVYMAPGNDDFFEADDIIAGSKSIVNCNDRVVPVGEYEMATFAWANPTPWNTIREKPEDELEVMLEDLIAKIQDKRSAIFNFHVPPYGSSLDLAPKLSRDLIASTGHQEHVGSKAVLKMIEKYQPLLGLHGHIHESRGIQKYGRTTCVNPGSEYSEGILRAVMLVIERGKLKDYIFTSG